MKQYLDLLRYVLENGIEKSDRTGTGTLSVFGYQNRHELSQGFPLVTTKKLHIKSIVHELLWFLSGDTNIKYLNDHGVHIWDEWSNEHGNLGPIYGAQWRKWYGVGAFIDQISNAIELLTKDQDSRRIIVSAWNVSELQDMAIPPCHVLFQFYVQPMSLQERRHFALINEQLVLMRDSKELECKALTEHGIPTHKLSCQLYQRSADVFLGVPFNIASYALLTHMVAHVTGLAVGEFIHTFGDVHLYKNHIEQAKLQLTHEPLSMPTLKLNPDVKSIFDFKYEDIEFENYQSHPAIKAEVSV